MYWNTCFLLSIQIGQLISCLGDLKESLALKDSFLKIKTKTSFYYPPTSVISILKAGKSFEREKLIEKFKEIYIEFNFCSVHWSYNKLQQWQNKPFSKHIEYYEPDRTHERNTYMYIEIFLTLHPQRTEEEARLGKTPRFQWHHSLNRPS